MTSAQSAACSQILAWAHTTHGVAMRVCDNPLPPSAAEGGLVYHSLGGIAWGDHPDCPGAPIIAQRPDVVAHAQTIIDGSKTVDVDVNLDQTLTVDDGETKSERQLAGDDWSFAWRGEGPFGTYIHNRFEQLVAGQAEILAAVKALSAPPVPPPPAVPPAPAG
jgi:hypothetical protein